MNPVGTLGWPNPLGKPNIVGGMMLGAEEVAMFGVEKPDEYVGMGWPIPVGKPNIVGGMLLGAEEVAMFGGVEKPDEYVGMGWPNPPPNGGSSMDGKPMRVCCTIDCIAIACIACIVCIVA
jgi:hypothetical protein